MYRLFLMLVVVLTGLLTACQKDVIQESFSRGANALLMTTDGNLMIAGFNSYKTTGYDALLVKTDLTGTEIWRKNFGTSASDGFYSVKNAIDGGFIAAGFTNNSTNVLSSVLLIKTDSKGNQVWKSTFGSPQDSQALGVAATSDTGYVCCGFIRASSQSNYDLFIVKVNSKGIAEWQKTYGTKNASGANDVAYSLVQDTDGGYLLTGTLDGQASCCGKTFLMKLSPAGDSLWTKTYSGETGYSIAKIPTGGYIIGGSAIINGIRNTYLLNVDGSGNKLWEKSYGSSQMEYGTSVVACADGGFALTGITSAAGTGNDDILLLRTNSLGEQSWTTTFGGIGVDHGYGLVQQPDGGFSISGSLNSGGSYIFLNRTASQGGETWEKLLK